MLCVLPIAHCQFTQTHRGEYVAGKVPLGPLERTNLDHVVNIVPLKHVLLGDKHRDVPGTLSDLASPQLLVIGTVNRSFLVAGVDLGGPSWPLLGSPELGDVTVVPQRHAPRSERHDTTAKHYGSEGLAKSVLATLTVATLARGGHAVFPVY